jgi:hypothetical protein
MPRMSDEDYYEYREYMEEKGEMDEAEAEAEAEIRGLWLLIEGAAERAWWRVHDSLPPGPALEAHLDLREALWRAAEERMQTITIEEYNGLSSYARYAVMHLPPWLTPISVGRGGS